VYVNVFARAQWQTVSICLSFTQCHIPKVVVLNHLRCTVKRNHRHTSELRHTLNIHPEIWHSAKVRGKNVLWVIWFCFIVCLFISFVFPSCLLSFFLPPSFIIPADSPAVGFSHIPQSVSLLIPRPDLKGSLKDESLYTVPDFVK